MPAKKKREPRINLLPREEFLSSTAGRVFAWVLSTFRVIVIVTEILVMIAFLSRFWLDARNTDLNELIKQKQAVLASSLEFEKEFKDIQARLKVFNDYVGGEDLVSKTLSTITSTIPPDVILTSVTFSGKQIVIEGKVAIETSIQQFIVNLDSSEVFEEVLLQTIRTKTEDQSLEFNITIPI